jgi:vacuolar-type H+-ATPase subunit H
MDAKTKIALLQQEAHDIVAEAKAEADEIIKAGADEAGGLYDDAARIIADAEARAMDMKDEIDEWIKMDAKANIADWFAGKIEEADKASSFFSKNRLIISLIAGVIVVAATIAILI